MVEIIVYISSVTGVGLKAYLAVRMLKVERLI